MSEKPRVAIVHDWLIGGGAERVVQALHELYPDAPIYTSYVTDEWRQRLDNKVVTGYLQHWPFSKLRKFVPFLRALWFSSLSLKGYDIVISSSGAEAKGVRVPKTTKHIAYIHAPTHYYWARYDQYLQQPGFGILDPLARIGLRVLVGPLRRWDYRAAQRPDVLLANSTYTKQQIKKYYGRDSEVVFPPVDVDRFKPKETKRGGFLIVGRQTPYKRFDLAVQACTKLNLELRVLGGGPDNTRLRALAGPTVSFTNKVSDKEVVEAMQTSEAFLFPGTDDFGIVAVEALASGCPVIAYKAGGALDYVTELSGLFFDKQSVESLVSTLKKFRERTYKTAAIVKESKRFSVDKFKEHIVKVVG